MIDVNTLFMLAILAILPFVAALQRYAVTYGYGGVSKSEARQHAKWTFVGTAVFLSAPTAAVTLL